MSNNTLYRVNAPGSPIDGATVEYVGPNPDGDAFTTMIFGPSAEYRLTEITPEIQESFDNAFEGDVPEDVSIERVFLYDDEVELVEAVA